MADSASESRLFVTGLPPNLTNEDLRKHFATRYQITDAQVVPGRRFGFVGLGNPGVAKDAIKYFNKTFIRMSRIGVDLAKPVDIEHSNGEQARPSTNRTSLKRKRDDRETSRTGLAPDSGHPATSSDASLTKTIKVVKSSVDVAHVGEPFEANMKSVDNVRGDSPERTTTTAHETHDKPEHTEEMEDMPADDDDAWLRSKTSRTLDLAETMDDAKEPGQNSNEDMEEEEDGHEHGSPETQEIEAESNEANYNTFTSKRLFLRNLPYSTEESDLQQLFSASFPQKIEEIHVVRDSRTKTNKGFAYVSFKDVETAQEAAKEFDGKPMQGRILHVLSATEKPSKKLDDYELSKLPLKKQKLIKRKMEAGTPALNWNSLYLNSDAVISSIADRLGVAKSQVLDPTSSDAAVKQAQAETHVIQETRTYFEKFGVDFDSFKDKPRGGRALLVKNLAYGTSADDLKVLFNACGEVTRILLPPSGVIAIVEFADDEQAHRAIKQLAYRNLKGSVLFLEKAPKDLFSKAPGMSVGENGPGDDAPVTDGTDTAEVPPAASYTLFVRNLSFATTSAGLADTFRVLEGFLSAKVKTRTDPKRPGEILSMGYGFVVFRTKRQAEVALKTMNGYRLDGHDLLVKFSQQSTDVAEERRREEAAKNNAAKKTKIIIKNLPFEATKKDIRALFGAYGQLRSVRVPQKFDRSTRGFAFAEFVTAREAEFAMDALKNTHLLGRRLVLEFATGDVNDPEEEIRAMEKKMGAQAEKVELSRITGTGRKKFVVGARDEMDAE
ncbi:putative pre-rrna processing protein [Phaeomoniella chlamydospora]|uniref:Multiple RNA-binding domain-containing protein 1 n=1 Tax=Phaeomoniella chlamydospora TaxID=158046 RepID=A0A0G2EYT6_PHACM|nr:putative pre-rrna processing protein [Phaeomoniella chlamydospora]